MGSIPTVSSSPVTVFSEVARCTRQAENLLRRATAFGGSNPS